MRPADIPQIAKLTKAEKILFVEDLWDEIAVEDDDIPVPGSHKQELDRRFVKHTQRPGEIITLEELQKRIEKRK
jgi:putative addiction module component (TIGR02574 family)